MDIQRGSIVAIMGPSGVGKTTILRLISGQLRPSKGSIEVNRKEVSGLSRRELYEGRKDIGVLLQNGALFTDLTVFENVATPLREHTRLPEETIHERVLAKLDSVGLAGTEELMPHSLSGGMARRVALARAVILNPKIVLFDEPMTGLDPIARSTISQSDPRNQRPTGSDQRYRHTQCRTDEEIGGLLLYSCHGKADSRRPATGPGTK